MNSDPVLTGSRTGELDTGNKEHRYAYPKCSSIQFLAREEGEAESPDMRRPSSGKGLQLWNKADIYSHLPSRSSFVLWNKLFRGKNTLPKMFAETNIFAKICQYLMSSKSFDKIGQHLFPNFFITYCGNLSHPPPPELYRFRQWCGFKTVVMDPDQAVRHACIQSRIRILIRILMKLGSEPAQISLKNFCSVRIRIRISDPDTKW
jgi:hypothetical protein